MDDYTEGVSPDGDVKPDMTSTAVRIVCKITIRTLVLYVCPFIETIIDITDGAQILETQKYVDGLTKLALWTEIAANILKIVKLIDFKGLNQRFRRARQAWNERGKPGMDVDDQVGTHIVYTDTIKISKGVQWRRLRKATGAKRTNMKVDVVVQNSKSSDIKTVQQRYRPVIKVAANIEVSVYTEQELESVHVHVTHHQQNLQQGGEALKVAGTALEHRKVSSDIVVRVYTGQELRSVNMIDLDQILQVERAVKAQLDAPILTTVVPHGPDNEPAVQPLKAIDVTNLQRRFQRVGKTIEVKRATDEQTKVAPSMDQGVNIVRKMKSIVFQQRVGKALEVNKAESRPAKAATRSPTAAPICKWNVLPKFQQTVKVLKGTKGASGIMKVANICAKNMPSLKSIDGKNALQGSWHALKAFNGKMKQQIRTKHKK